jgi:hypothetical protein
MFSEYLQSKKEVKADMKFKVAQREGLSLGEKVKLVDDSIKGS